MSTTFNLTNTATEVNTALQAVVGADTTPDAASVNMVTSQGVFNHVNTELGPFKGKTLTTESTGIANTDNDTSVPTSAAVNAAISDIVKSATYTVADFTSSFNSQDFNLSFTESSDPNNIGSANGTTITLGAGTYIASLTGEFLGGTSINNKFVGKFSYNNAVDVLTNGVFSNINVDSSSSGFFNRGCTAMFSSRVSQTLGFGFFETGSASMQYRNVSLTVIKLA